MANAGDKDERGIEGWQQVGLDLTSRIAAESQRLVGQLRQRVGSLVSRLAGRQYLPVWFPDYGTFASALWTERLVSRVYDTIESLPGVPHETLPLRQEPSSFVWFRRGPTRTMTAGDDQGVEADEMPVIETPALPQPAGGPLLPSTAHTSRQGPAAKIRRMVTDPRLGRSWDGTALFKPGRAPGLAQPAELLQPEQVLRPEAPAQLPTLHPVSFQPEDDEEAVPPMPEIAPDADTVVPGTTQDVRPVTDRQWPQVTATTHATAASGPASPTRLIMPGVRRLTSFAHSVLEGRERLLPRNVPISILHASPPSSTTDVPGPDERRQPARSESQSGLALASFAPSVEPAPPSETHGYDAEDRAGPRPEIARVSKPLGRAAHLMDAAPVSHITTPFLFPTQFEPTAPEWGYPDFALPVSPHTGHPSTRPLSAWEYAAASKPQPVASAHDTREPTPQWPFEATTPASPAPAGADHGHAGDFTPTTTPGAGLPATGAIPGLALAPLQRPRSGEGAMPPEPTEGEVSGAEEETEEQTEMNLDRLAREVYAILKRRLAWEKERTLA